MKSCYVYLVYCNPKTPLIYGVYHNKKSALKYAKQLVDWRFNRAKENGYEYGYYHNYLNDSKKETDFDKREKIVFSACLKIKDNYELWSDDGCEVKVVRRPLLN